MSDYMLEAEKLFTKTAVADFETFCKNIAEALETAEKRGHEQCRTDFYSVIRIEMNSWKAANDMANKAEKRGRIAGLREAADAAYENMDVPTRFGRSLLKHAEELERG